MTLHGTREAEVDTLLRRGILVDLYKVVREGIRVSEPRYSLKNIEQFYLTERAGKVTDAAASIVFYEKWIETGDKRFLADIEKYNCDDVRSTYELRQWLLTLRPQELPRLHETAALKPPPDAALSPHEQRLEEYHQRLLAGLPGDRNKWNTDNLRRELAFYLLDFHRRAEKPLWWAMFARQEMTVDELIDDGECLGGLVIHPDYPPVPDKRSTLYTYSFPEQETKLKTGDAAVCVETLGSLSSLVIDEDQNLVTFKHNGKPEPLDREINIGPGRPYNTKKITEALFRYADDLLEGSNRYRAVGALLAAEPPSIAGHEPGTPLIDEAKELLPQLIHVVENLQESYLFIQGPPGSGKTYSGAHVITALLEKGYRVGITSNSHKAIINLLKKIEENAVARNIFFRGVKKSTAGKPDSIMAGRLIDDVYTNDEAMAPGYQLVAGTAWLFSDYGMDQSLDFLFVDEAGQVALANIVAMGTSARNIILIGDQMQLGQPVQGVHPGRSGDSSLQYLLGDQATISPEHGIFLKTTWRMHPHVCRFISDAVYNGRLEPEKDNVKRQLLLTPHAHPILKPSGVSFYPVEHDGCSQRSEAEAEAVNELVHNLLTQQYQDKNGNIARITLENIVIVAPYNMQVNLLQNLLPETARIGTVDKFQGQEAEVVIISMATSSEEYMPRFISFLYSKNRLNVAISRARSLAILVANPLLLSIRCKKTEEMALVNMLCWVREYSKFQQNHI
jgi:hypothetical protein